MHVLVSDIRAWSERLVSVKSEVCTMYWWTHVPKYAQVHTEPSVHTYVHNTKIKDKESEYVSKFNISSQPSAASEGKLPYSIIILQKYFLYTLTVELYKYVYVVTYVPSIYSSWAVKKRQNHRIRSTRYYVAAETLALWSQQKNHRPPFSSYFFPPTCIHGCLLMKRTTFISVSPKATTYAEEWQLI